MLRMMSLAGSSTNDRSFCNLCVMKPSLHPTWILSFLPSCEYISVSGLPLSAMPIFRWPELLNDIALAKDVMSFSPEKPCDWEAIATTLSALFSTDDKPVILKGRGCRKHTDLLIKRFKEEDAKSLKRSGTEEDYTELCQLLEDISSNLRDFNALKATLAAQRAAQLKRQNKIRERGMK